MKKYDLHVLKHEKSPSENPLYRVVYRAGVFHKTKPVKGGIIEFESTMEEVPFIGPDAIVYGECLIGPGVKVDGRTVLDTVKLQTIGSVLNSNLKGTKATAGKINITNSTIVDGEIAGGNVSIEHCTLERTFRIESTEVKLMLVTTKEYFYLGPRVQLIVNMPKLGGEWHKNPLSLVNNRFGHVYEVFKGLVHIQNQIATWDAHYSRYKNNVTYPSRRVKRMMVREFKALRTLAHVEG